MSTNFGFSPSVYGEHYFISYTTEDASSVRPIVQILHNSNVPLWYDYGLEYGKIWEEQIAANIKTCKAVIMFITAGLFTKDDSYVQKEYTIACMYKKRIIPVFLDDIDAEKIPAKYAAFWAALVAFQGITYSKYATPQHIAQSIHSAINHHYTPILSAFHPISPVKKQLFNHIITGGIATLLVILAVFIIFKLGKTPTPDNSAPPPTTTTTAENHPKPRFTSYNHSSAILNNKDEYHSKRAFDGLLGTSWQENVSGLGIGEWLECSANSTQYVNRITIYNGHSSSGSAYLYNGRVLRLTIETDNFFQSYNITDEYKVPTIIEFDQPLECTFIRFIIDDAVGGSTWQDVAIAEIVIE